MAKIAKLDVRTFTRAFFASTGYTPYAYFTMRRIKLAQSLLNQSNMTITNIAHQVGYGSASKFSSAFKKLTGKSPSTWRRG